ncbi:hypothetical protein CYLTODRAFT_247241 [Cylindrobasidium torrendii FP15055 ss-10]|uniref:Glucose receptor Git3 N-terminal domain-containing protein n=1 Tax=Cylindrobasidium torrendii FP15055 ss-10 TaxID=1314674 RepID=A0A0D7BF70_9AGAR|nr:hypothetical protein CYLTODRAFT_247241 [Cylindrobasidium torrendii FP15055 ss-10]
MLSLFLVQAVKRASRKNLHKWISERTAMEFLMIALFCADLLHSLGGILNYRWIAAENVYTGSYCIFQGTVQQLGETSVSIVTLIMAVYTFVVIRSHWVRSTKNDVRFILRLLLGMAVLISLTVGIGFCVRGERYIEPTPYWCWISNREPLNIVFKLFAGYLWHWLTILTSIVVYLILAFWIRGNAHFPPQSPFWRVSFTLRREPPSAVDGRLKPWVMLAYPAIFCLTIIPASVNRWLGFVHPESMTLLSTFCGSSIYRLSGIFNVVLLLSTRPRTGLFRWTPAEEPLQDTGNRFPRRTLEAFSVTEDLELSGREVFVGDESSVDKSEEGTGSGGLRRTKTDGSR